MCAFAALWFWWEQCSRHWQVLYVWLLPSLLDWCLTCGSSTEEPSIKLTLPLRPMLSLKLLSWIFVSYFHSVIRFNSVWVQVPCIYWLIYSMRNYTKSVRTFKAKEWCYNVGCGILQWFQCSRLQLWIYVDCGIVEWMICLFGSGCEFWDAVRAAEKEWRLFF